MRIKSARQAWHDCFLDSRPSIICGAMEEAKLQASVQKTIKAASITAANAAIHQIMSGNVQHAIGTLPPPLQAFGNWLYAPEGFFDDKENAVWQMIALLSDVMNQDSAEWYLARCALHCYRQNAWGRYSELNGARAIGVWLYENHGIEINSRRFSERYGTLWNKFRSVMDDLDRRALTPVSRVVWLVNEELDYGDSFLWGNHKVLLSKL